MFIFFTDNKYELNFQVVIYITICHNMVSSVKMM